MTSRKTYSSLAKEIAEQTGLPISTVRDILLGMFLTIKEQVLLDERVTIRSFGSFHLKKRKPRSYRDIHTGEIRKTVGGPIASFTPSKCLIDAINVNKTKTVDSKRREKEVPPSVDPLPTVKTKQSATRISQVDEESSSVIVVKSVPNPRQTNDLRIRYTPCNSMDNDDGYPLVFTPKQSSLLKLPREGRSDIRGYKEADFMAALCAANLGVVVSDSFHMTIPYRSIPYEPDIVVYDESINLYIDVEIDEPYDGFSRLITHNVESTDKIRDTYFKESGWVVVRFTEKQVHLHCESCIKFLKDLIDLLKSGIKVSCNFPEYEKRWNIPQGIKWEKDLYREKYLGIQSFSKQTRSIKIVCDNTIDEIDKLIQRTEIHPKAQPQKPLDTQESETCGSRTYQLIPSSVPARVTKSFSDEHPPKLSFDEDSHSYFAPEDLSGNSDHISVTTLIDRFFPYFDEEAYIKKRMAETGMTEEEIRKELSEPSSRGTYMHKQIESFLKGEEFDDTSKEFRLFKKFYEEKIMTKGLVFDSAEIPIELHEYNIAGTVDALFRKHDGEYVMVDWKRSTHLIIDGYPKKYGYGRGLSVLSHLDNSSYYKYELQQSFYKYILEKEYGIKISSMILAVLHPDYDRYYTIKLSDYRKKEVLDILEAYENIK